ncbi:MAG: hypothetical protein E5X78_11665 [Mesorhizobium sp.]|nr:MAG: hypothetical protein E5X78_11665 [Mesorhizobium sp.]
MLEALVGPSRAGVRLFPLGDPDAEAARHVLAGEVRPGFQTPGGLFGNGFAETIADTRIMPGKPELDGSAFNYIRPASTRIPCSPARLTARRRSVLVQAAVCPAAPPGDRKIGHRPSTGRTDPERR